MEAKLEFLRKGLTGDIWGLIGEDGLVVRQYPSRSAEEALEFFLDQAKSLTADDGISSIVLEGRVINL